METIRRADREFHVTAVQSEYSMWFCELEDEILPVMEDLNIGLVPFSPLGKGALTGNVSRDQRFAQGDIRATIPRFNEPEKLEHNLALADQVKAFAEKKGTTPARVALAWVLAQKPWIVPIPGTKKLHRLEENLGAADLELTESDLRELRAIIDGTEIVGDRYDKYGMAMTRR